MISHIVLFKPRADLAEDELRSFAKSVVGSFRSIPSIRRISIGRSVSVAAGYDRSMGDTTYKFAAVLEFDDEAGLIAYLNHPRHAEMGRLFWECCERSVVCEVRAVDLEAPDVVDQLVE